MFNMGHSMKYVCYRNVGDGFNDKRERGVNRIKCNSVESIDLIILWNQYWTSVRITGKIDIYKQFAKHESESCVIL